LRHILRKDSRFADILSERCGPHQTQLKSPAEFRYCILRRSATKPRNSRAATRTSDVDHVLCLEPSADGFHSAPLASRLTLRCPGREQIRVLPGFLAMGIPEENRNMVLLASVTLVCALIAIIATAFEPEPSTARTASKQTALADQPAVRVVGVPFVPNTNPREHN
jgi:hypothetical protein